jgi:hypothetical protein
MAADVPFPHPRLDVFKPKGPAATRILSDPGPSHNRRGSLTLTTPIAGGPGPTPDSVATARRSCLHGALIRNAMGKMRRFCPPTRSSAEAEFA